jgi:hypothetical protein
MCRGTGKITVYFDEDARIETDCNCVHQEVAIVSTAEELINAVEQGDSVFLLPGTYNLVKPLLMRDGQSLRGLKH